VIGSCEKNVRPRVVPIDTKKNKTITYLHVGETMAALYDCECKPIFREQHIQSVQSPYKFQSSQFSRDQGRNRNHSIFSIDLQNV
jgi:hypothetical protein